MILSLPPVAAAWLGTHHGVATTAELGRRDVGRNALNRLCDIGILARVGRGVYASTTHPPTLEHRCRILSCVHPQGFVTGPTGAMLGGLRRQPFAAGLHFSVRHGVHLDSITGVEFRQTTQLCAVDRRTRVDGIAVASWPRLAFDLAADLRSLDHRSVIHQLLDRRLVTAAELVSIGARLCHPARRGSTTFRASLLELGQEVSDSHPEVLMLEALRRRGVPVDPQVPVDVGGRVVHLDLGVAEHRWGVELDIHPEHRSVDGHHRDSRRVRSLHVSSWQIEPVSELDLGDVERLADELAELYRERRLAIRVSQTGGVGR